MDRFEIKQMLIDMGMRSEFVEMPIIVETIYSEFSDVPLERAMKSNRICIRDDGSFCFGNKEVSLNKDGGATIVDGDLVIKTNEYGMEISVLEGNPLGRFNNIRRNDGKIIHRFGNSADSRLTEIIVADTGDWSIQNSRQHPLITNIIHGDKVETRIAEARPEIVMDDFEYNVTSVISNYPRVAPYYDGLRELVKKSLDRQTDPLQREIFKSEGLKSQIEELNAEKSELSVSLEKSTTMLGAALKFIERVRNHPIGKMFFGKDAKEFEESTARLYSGNEEREDN